MAICISCGKETDSHLCESCRPHVDVEDLCRKVIAYRPGEGSNPIWEQICFEMDDPYYLSEVVHDLITELPTPRKEYMLVMAAVREYSNVTKDKRSWFYEIYDAIRHSEGLTESEKLRLDGIAVGARFMDYDYQEADEIASVLCTADSIPWQASDNLADFYTKTRRYDLADEVISKALERFAGHDFAIRSMNIRAEDNKKQKEKAQAGKQEYLPNPKEGRDEVRGKYVEFLASIGIDVSIPSTRRSKDAIPKDQYPEPVESRDASINSFVAFDLETTGRSSVRDSIIEIGAVKVVDGQIVESAEYTFQEIVQPLDHKKLSAEVEDLTGITTKDVVKARPIWEVLPDFMKFVGNDVIVGFNCMAFDSRFMVRAGRYSHLIIENKYFDVMRYAKQFHAKLGIGSQKTSLNELSEKLGIENSRAHRALSDAVTTAKVFLALKKMDTGDENGSVEDLLSDLDTW